MRKNYKAIRVDERTFNVYQQFKKHMIADASKGIPVTITDSMLIFGLIDAWYAEDNRRKTEETSKS